MEIPVQQISALARVSALIHVIVAWELRKMMMDDLFWGRMAGGEATIVVVDLLLDESPLLEDSATIAECGLSNDKAVLAIFKQRCVECVRWQDAQEDLTVADNPVRLIIPDGTTELPQRLSQGVDPYRV